MIHHGLVGCSFVLSTCTHEKLKCIVYFNADLDFYHDVVKECQQDTEKNLKILTKAVRDKEVVSFPNSWFIDFGN